MDFLKGLLGKLGAVVDAAVPVAQGDRTKISALVAVVAPLVCGAIESAGVPGACAALTGLGQLAASLVPLFAVAGLVRK